MLGTPTFCFVIKGIPPKFICRSKLTQQTQHTRQTSFYYIRDSYENAVILL